MLTLLLSVLVFGLRADERSQEIMRKMMAELNSYKSYSVTFTATMAGEFDALPGELIVSGEKYYLDVYDSKVYFDGKNGYTYSETNEEVIIEKPDPNDNRLFANPAKIFALYERDFNSNYIGTASVGTKKATKIELTPKSADTGYNKVILYAGADGIPLKVVYHLSEYGKDLVLDVVRFVSNVSVGEDTFRFNPAQYPDVEVIDFR